MCDGNEYDVVLLKMNTIILAKHVANVNLWHTFSAVHYLLILFINPLLIKPYILIMYGEFPIVRIILF